MIKYLIIICYFITAVLTYGFTKEIFKQERERNKVSDYEEICVALAAFSPLGTLFIISVFLLFKFIKKPPYKVKFCFRMPQHLKALI